MVEGPGNPGRPPCLGLGPTCAGFSHLPDRSRYFKKHLLQRVLLFLLLASVLQTPNFIPAGLN